MNNPTTQHDYDEMAAKIVGQQEEIDCQTRRLWEMEKSDQHPQRFRPTIKHTGLMRPDVAIMEPHPDGEYVLCPLPNLPPQP